MRIPFSVWLGLALAVLCGLLPGEPWSALAQSGGGSSARLYVANSVDNNVSIIDPVQNQVVTTIAVGKGPNSLAANPMQPRVYVSNFDDNTISILDTETDQVVGEPISVGINPAGIAVTPDGIFVYVTNFGSATVSVLNTSTGGAAAMEPLKTLSGPIGVAVRATGSRVLVTNNLGNTLSHYVFDTTAQTNRPLPATRLGLRPLGVAVHPSSGRIYVANSGENTVSVLDGDSGKTIGTLKVGRSPAGVVVLPQTGRAYVTNFGDNTISVLEVPAKPPAARLYEKVIRQVRTGGEGPLGAAASPDEKQIYVTNFTDGTVSVISTATDEETVPIPVGQGPNGILYH